jgi:cupredoxin-like protein
MTLNAFVTTGFHWKNNMRALLFCLALTGVLLLPAAQGRAGDGLTTTIKDHKFDPAEIKVPANKRVVITVINNDPTPEEFDSTALKVEKVIPGNSKGVVRIGPLKPGKYPFIGEYHEATAKGVVIAE